MIPQNMVTFIIEKLKETVNPYWIIVFGSTAENREREDSDIDIAYASDIMLGNYERFLLAQELANIVHKEVDLVDLSEASTIFQAQIIHKGKTIYCSDEERKIVFEMKALKMYARLNEERQVIFDDIKKRGTIYEE
ncbi:type VII toxin-antitoxin system MntA family adenylyltransferase antitoxin [Bacillus gaemokensis]|uniref:DNA polymerase subunit beta n=1 Tax=Bacillus gaemokensis TaxID=574375 RepID=A0A073KEH5_9BACI|nr:nucleotidyltransferase domain-containing protein [Bacillus gaemokensis]KEK24930.1 DNA polymerase subunit beta [Bacillus gaemokensis]KYG30240.1 DNA polymerase subunit beta [Bacillus gaemokensis]